MKAKGNVMPSTVLDNIKGSEIPPVWLKKIKENPDKMFKITIEVKQEEAPQEDKKGKWAAVLADFRKKPFSKDASETLQKASRSFRDGFSFREPPHFTNSKK